MKVDVTNWHIDSEMRRGKTDSRTVLMRFASQ